MNITNAVTNFLQRHSLVIGFGLMFLLTWPIDLANSGIIQVELPFLVYIFLGWGFVIAAVIMTGITLGLHGVIDLLKRYLIWRVALKWYLVAFFLSPIFMWISIHLNAAFTHVPPDFNTAVVYQIFGGGVQLPIIVLPFFLFEMLSNGEEIGWRGYVLPRLQTKFNALASSLILGIVWGFWHLPKYLSDWDAVSFFWFMVHILAISILMTWLYNNTQGSLLLVAIFHAASNTAGVLLPISNRLAEQNMGAYIFFVLCELAAALIVTIMAGPAKLIRREPVVGESA